MSHISTIGLPTCGILIATCLYGWGCFVLLNYQTSSEGCIVLFWLTDCWPKPSQQSLLSQQSQIGLGASLRKNPEVCQLRYLLYLMYFLLKNWYAVQSKGCFYADRDGTVASHQYHLELTRDTQIWLTIHSTAGSKIGMIVQEHGGPLANHKCNYHIYCFAVWSLQGAYGTGCKYVHV